ncbi:MAG: hypothetical protein KIT84_25590 [Labilithrix sp.]|nr:hypothetical protein [Labilithrix sp.]MCW5814426.1 hypothetical protein [Labilithrix sp.]
MRRALSLFPLILLACTQAVQEDAAASSEQSATADFAPYPTEVRAGMRRLEPFEPLGASVMDLGAAARDQGSLAACASFSFLGLLENQLFNERGITPDLSERFMVYSNYFQTGTLGGDPGVIARFAELTAKIGVLPESAYPYSAVAKNMHRFESDAAQGLVTDSAGEVMLTDAIAGTADSTKERSDVVAGPKYLGQLPAGPYPVTLPMKATIAPNARIPEVELDGKHASCFSANPEAATNKLQVTPREALVMCFDFDPNRYFTCNFDAAAAGEAADAAATGDDECSLTSSAIEHMVDAQLAAHKKSLQLALGLMDKGDAAFLALAVPAAPNNREPVWMTTVEMGAGGGHAVVGVGYVTAEEIDSVAEQSRGILVNGAFDRLAKSLDPDYGPVPSDPAAQRDLRRSSLLGRIVRAEGGIVLFRNSWGSAVGVDGDGTQAMTFNFFLRQGMLVQGRTQPRLGGVAWNGSACPAATNLTYGGTWLETESRAPLQKYYREKFLPPQCR